MRKIFFLKHYEVTTIEEGQSATEAYDKAITKLSEIMQYHLNFMLIDYVDSHRDDRLKILNLGYQKPNFEFFLLLFDNPFKIKLNFYTNKKVAKTFIEALFNYMQHQLTCAKNNEPHIIDWITSPKHVNFNASLNIIEKNNSCFV